MAFTSTLFEDEGEDVLACNRTTVITWEYYQLIERSIFTLISVPIAIWSIINIIRARRQTQKKRRADLPKFLYIANILYFIVVMLYFVFFLVFKILSCAEYSSYSFIILWLSLGTLCYILHWAFLIIIYLSRLIGIFDGTPLSISKKSICKYIGVSTLLIIFAIVWQSIFSQSYIEGVVDANFVMLAVGFVLTFLCFGIVAFLLSFAFIKRLFQVRICKHRHAFCISTRLCTQCAR